MEKFEHIDAMVLADSICDGKRITTFQVRVPRIILAEANTHRVFCRNYSSSRAIPSKKLRAEVLENPFMPVYWGQNKSGMSAQNELYGFNKWICKKLWIGLSKVAVFTHWMMEKAGLHKQTCNRILEPWLSVTGIITATEWDNFFKLRCSSAAQPEMQQLAFKMQTAMLNSEPKEIPTDMPNKWSVDEIHLPFIGQEDIDKGYDLSELIKIAVARCCRVSYDKLGEPGNRSDPEQDLKLFEKLKTNGHMSPFEHIALPLIYKIDPTYHCRNYKGWVSIRSFIEPEDRSGLLEECYGIKL